MTSQTGNGHLRRAPARTSIRIIGWRAPAVLLLLLTGCDSEIDPKGDACFDAAGDDSSTPRTDSSVGPDGGAGEEDAGGEEDADGGVEDAGEGDADGEEDAGESDAASCEPPDATLALDEAEQQVLATLSPLPAVPADPTNQYADNAMAAVLGQKLFFEKAYSGPLRVASDLGAVGDKGKVSCASCHSGSQLADQRSMPANVSLGTDFHTRNAPGIVNSAFYRWTNWGGRFSAQWELPLPVSENPVIMNSTRLRVAHVIFDKYRSEYEAVFGALEPAIGSDAVRFPPEGKPKAPTGMDGPWEAMTDGDRAIVNRIFVNFGKALQAYMRKLVSRDAPFDTFVAGEEDAIGEAEKRGLKLFLGKARCVTCHLGPHLSDGTFHNLGVAQAGEHVPAADEGRFKDIPGLIDSPFSSATSWSDDLTTGRLLGLTKPPPAETRNQFRTPSLRGVADSAPYMHSGQIATLAGVVGFYNGGGGSAGAGSQRDPLLVPLSLSTEERADLVAFLETLTGEALPAALVEDTSTAP